MFNLLCSCKKFAQVKEIFAPKEMPPKLSFKVLGNGFFRSKMVLEALLSHIGPV